MQIKDLFAADVTRDIPPVVYFHEQDPEKLRQEVSEYIVTGGYREGDPRQQRVPRGIHEEFVDLLRTMADEIARGPTLPASWISGFYGSGKSSFAKLLGLALDGKVLPDGTALAEALLRRDDSPRAAELTEAWRNLRDRIDPIAVVFDIGAVARESDHIHTAAFRLVQNRLGYCRTNHLVAEYELRLERDNRWTEFLDAAQKALKRPWSEVKDTQMAGDHFSHALHVLDPGKYPDPMSWIDSHVGGRHGIGTSVEEVSRALRAALDIRAKDKTLFLVVDEVSQYVHNDQNRMDRLRAFISDLGQQHCGKVWLLATGQQKLEDSDTTSLLHWMKDRFPPQLRVHLATTNIRDVVHKRLLRKDPAKESELRELFRLHGADLRLHGFRCESITEEDFVEVYPLVPEHVDLFMRITSALRLQTNRLQGDDYAVRGLLQLLGELFRRKGLAESGIGQLVTLDAVYDIQSTALDAETQNTLNLALNDPLVRDDALAARALKAIALLQPIAAQIPVTAELVAQVLYERIGQGSRKAEIEAVLGRITDSNLLAFSAKEGYRVQSSAGQEWAAERDRFTVPADKVSELVREVLPDLCATHDAPKLKGVPFRSNVWFSDERFSKDQRLVNARTDACLDVDLRWLTDPAKRDPAEFLRATAADLRDRLVWVVGDSAAAEELAREYGKSKGMADRYEGRRAMLSQDKLRLLVDEQAKRDVLSGKLSAALGEAFMAGAIYFRGRRMEPRDFASAFGPALKSLADRVLPDLFPYFTETAIGDTEFGDLFRADLAGASQKLVALGILELDEGKLVARCAGEVPARILRVVETLSGVSGASLVKEFQRPPYGWPLDVIRACLAGLLRGRHIRIRPAEGAEITSWRDPGAREVFADRALRIADILPATKSDITAVDRARIRKFFADMLKVEVDPDNEPIADAVYQYFPGRRDRLRAVEELLDRLPSRPSVPPQLSALARALEDCRRSRHVEETVREVKRNLDSLRDGLQTLGIIESELTEDVVGQVTALARIRDHELTQLEAYLGEDADDIAADATVLRDHLSLDRPWRDLPDIRTLADGLLARYRTERAQMLADFEARADSARDRVRRRPGFELLTPDQALQVLRPIALAIPQSPADAVAPTLADLRTIVPAKLAEAEETANARLDAELEDATDQPVQPVRLALKGRELATAEDLKQLLQEIDDEVRPLIERGVRVRLG